MCPVTFLIRLEIFFFWLGSQCLLQGLTELLVDTGVLSGSGSDEAGNTVSGNAGLASHVAKLMPFFKECQAVKSRPQADLLEFFFDYVTARAGTVHHADFTHEPAALEPLDLVAACRT